jgi:hypothetical protein
MVTVERDQSPRCALPTVADNLREEMIVVKEPNAPQAASADPPRSPTPSSGILRLRPILGWSGLTLLGTAGLTVTMAAMWQAPNMILLAGVYGAIGSLTLIASAAGH